MADSLGLRTRMHCFITLISMSRWDPLALPASPVLLGNLEGWSAWTHPSVLLFLPFRISPCSAPSSRSSALTPSLQYSLEIYLENPGNDQPLVYTRCAGCKGAVDTSLQPAQASAVLLAFGSDDSMSSNLSSPPWSPGGSTSVVAEVGSFRTSLCWRGL